MEWQLTSNRRLISPRVLEAVGEILELGQGGSRDTLALLFEDGRLKRWSIHSAEDPSGLERYDDRAGLLAEAMRLVAEGAHSP